MASENNWVYAFWVDNSSPPTFTMVKCWATPLNGSGEYSIPFTALPPTGPLTCNNVVPESGITSTPVIDTKSKPPVMYVVTGHQVPPSSNPTYTYRLHAIRLDTGADVVSGGPFDLVSNINSFLQSQSGGQSYPFKAQQQNQRVGLAMYRTTNSAGKPADNIYIGFGSFCDSNITTSDQYSGYIAGVQFVFATQTFSTIGVFTSENAPTLANGEDGGIWMGGGAPVLDGGNNLYFGVGNGNWNGTGSARPNKFGHSIVQLFQTTGSSPNLVAVDYYTPNDWSILNSNPGQLSVCTGNNTGGSCSPNGSLIQPLHGDLDVGSGGATLLTPTIATGTNPPCTSNQQIIAGGKEGVFYETCYSTSTSSSPQSTMGGLDFCGYSWTGTCLGSDIDATACTQFTSLPPPAGTIAQCFPAVDVTNTINNNGNGPGPGSRATAAFWAGNSATQGNYLYIAGSADGLKGYHMNPNSSYIFGAAVVGNKPTDYHYPGASPVLSWGGSNMGNGLLWVIDPLGAGFWNGSSTSAALDTQLDVYSPTPLNGILTRLWSSGTGNGPGTVNFAVPTVANGMVFVAGGNNNPAYAPGKWTLTNGVNCSPAALGGPNNPTCVGLLAVYGKLTP